jgi:DNA-binding protein HU-beta
VNSQEMIDKIAADADLPKGKVKPLIDALFATIVDAASRGEEVSITGFGKFRVKQTPARQGRNPSTGEPIQIAASKKVAFTPSKTLKNKVQG